MERVHKVSNQDVNTLKETSKVDRSAPPKSIDEIDNQHKTESTSKQKSGKKWLLSCLIILVIIALGIAGYFAFKYNQLNNKVTSLTREQNITSTSKPEEGLSNNIEETSIHELTSDWNTYSNEYFGFEFRFPQNWVAYSETFDNPHKQVLVEKIQDLKAADPDCTGGGCFLGESPKRVFFIIEKLKINTIVEPDLEKKENENLSDWIKRYINNHNSQYYNNSTYNIVVTENLEINGNNAVKVEATIYTGAFVLGEYFIENEEFGIVSIGMWNNYGDNKNIFDQIISTFKFI